MRVAVLGMGRMGQAMALRLLDLGNEVTVWNRSPGKAAEVVAQGAEEAGSIAQALRGVDAAVTSLANDDAVRKVALGPEGVQANLEGALYADASTVSPSLSATLEKTLEAFVAMPILGAPAALRSGKATVLLGGHDGPVARAEPVAAALSTATKRYPAAAMASSAKLASNLLLLDAVVALAESFTVGRAGGLTDDQLRELLGESPMVPPGLQNRFEAILAGQGPAWWSDALGGKDARLALEVARSAGHDLPVTSAACDQYEEAAREGFAEEDITAVARLYRH